MVRIEQVEPASVTTQAGELLCRVWDRPCLHYTPQYLAWQFAFPGAAGTVTVAAFEGADLIGFIGAVSRRLRAGSTVTGAHLVSFLAVAPEWRRTHVPGGLYIKFLPILRATGLPVIRFAVPGSAGDRSGERVYPAMGYTQRQLGPFTGYGYVPSGSTAPGDIRVVGAATPEDLLASAAACSGEGTIWNDPDEATLEHYARDPRPHALVMAARPDGRPVGGAICVEAEFLTAQGARTVVSFENLWLSAEPGNALRALGEFAAGRWRDRAAPLRIAFPSVWSVPSTDLEDAGLRMRGGAFTGYAYATGADHPFLKAHGTNLEIV